MDQARADALAMGATPESVEAAHGPEQKEFAVWPENWAALQAFLSVQSQWAVGMSGPTGLDYVRVKAGLEMAGVAITPELFAQLRLLERGALDAMSGKPKDSSTPKN